MAPGREEDNQCRAAKLRIGCDGKIPSIVHAELGSVLKSGAWPGRK